MRVITEFDPWKSRICTCPRKYSFNPYTGCAHHCIYCYSTYIPDFYRLRQKKMLLPRLERDLRTLPENALISMSNSSDPYPPVEKELELTRKAVEMISERNLRLLVVTKSDTVVRDADILERMRSAVSVTITTLSSETASVLEPDAPAPYKRIKALRKIKNSGIPAILRLDPVIPLINDHEIEKLLEKASFVDHVVSSTLKLRGDSYRRMIAAFPELKEKLREMYFREGEKLGNSWYMKKEIRKKILQRVAEKCEELEISYGFCREGLFFKSRSCDGSHLIQ